MHNTFFAWDEASDHLVALDPFDDVEDPQILADMRKVLRSALLSSAQPIVCTDPRRSK